MKEKHPWRDKSLLEELYWNELMSMRQIARRFDVQKITISEWMHRNDIDVRSRSEATTARMIRDRDDPMNDPVILERLYHEHELSAPDMVKYLPVESDQAVYDAMRRNGVGLRGYTSAAKLSWDTKRSKEKTDTGVQEAVTDGGVEVEKTEKNPVEICVPNIPGMVRDVAEEMSESETSVTIKVEAYDPDVIAETRDEQEDVTTVEYGDNTYRIGTGASVNERKASSDLPCIMPGSKTAVVATEIYQRGPMQVRDIAQRTEITAGHVSAILCALRDRGLMESKTGSSTNGRTNVSELTVAGEDAVEAFV